MSGKDVNEDMVEHMKKRRGTEEPRLAVRLKSYADLNYKRQRAGAARRHYHSKRKSAAPRIKAERDIKDKTIEQQDKLGNDNDHEKRRYLEDNQRGSEGPGDKCGRRRRRPRSCCCRKRRRRRSCGRRRRRRRRRSCGRRRRRRSCSCRRRRKRRKRC